MPDGRVAVVLGDVAGKGVPASLLMAKLSAEARFCLLTQPTIPAAVMLLNEQLIRGGIGDRFVTLAAVVIDPTNHRCTIVNAGHINPAVFNCQKLTYADLVTNAQSGIPLGIMSGFDYEAVEISLELGDTLLLFTDGVSDAMAPNGEMFGMEGVPKSLTDENPLGVPNRPKAVGDRVVHTVKKHANGRPQNDDIAFVAFGRLDPALGPTTGTSSSTNLPIPENIRGTGPYN
jgi:phosphoserine phosphatase RsbU/P